MRLSKRKISKSPADNRPSWDEYFLDIVKAVAKRATCDRGRTGSVIVRDKRIIATGYVGAPSGLRHCDEIGHLMKGTLREDGTKSMHCVRTTHAEANAIAQAAKYGVSVNGATVYCILEPCLDCAKLLINSGIKRVVCEKRYHAGHDTREFFKRAGVELVCLTDEVMEYSNQK